MKFSMFTIAAFGSTMRKYATAFTRAGHVVLRDHFLRRDVQRDRAQVDLDHPVDDRDQQEEARALRRVSRRPSRKTTPRSYSRATLTAATRKSRRRKTTAASDDQSGGHGAILYPVHLRAEPLDVVDADVRAGLERRAVRRRSLPELAVHEDGAAVSATTPSAPTIAGIAGGPGAVAPATALPSAKPMKPPIDAVTTSDEPALTWYGAGASWNSISIPTAKRDQRRRR